MRRRWALLLALVLVPLGGCFTAQPEPEITRRDARLPFAAPDGDDLVVLEVAYLECAVNDRYVNGPLWDFVDESDNAARQAELHANGFRLGNLGPTLPDRLLDLILSERNAANIRERRVPEGQPAALPVGPSWTHCRYELRQDGAAVHAAGAARRRAGAAASGAGPVRRAALGATVQPVRRALPVAELGADAGAE